MRKIILITTIAIILVVFISAICLGISNNNPEIIDIKITPLKVMPGIPLQINIKVMSNNEVDSAFATFNYENGSDTMRMVRTYSSNNTEEFSAVWLTHDTLDQKWYTTDLVITDKAGRKTEKTVDWQDPVVSHNWSELLGAGYCILSFNHSTCPDGYSSLGTTNRYIRFNSTNVGGTGGSTTHRHTVNGSTSAPLEYPAATYKGDGDWNGADRYHHHYVNTFTDIVDNDPFNFHINICCRT